MYNPNSTNCVAAFITVGTLKTVIGRSDKPTQRYFWSGTHDIKNREHVDLLLRSAAE